MSKEEILEKWQHHFFHASLQHELENDLTAFEQSTKDACAKAATEQLDWLHPEDTKLLIQAIKGKIK